MSQLEAFLISHALEAPTALAVAWLALGTRARTLVYVGLAALLATTLTHPVAWWLNQVLQGVPYPPRVAALELVIVLVEAGVYRAVARLPLRRALLVSFVANATSYALGMVIWWATD